MWNVHRMSIKIEHRNLEIRKTHDFFVQVRNFLLPMSLKVFDIRRETHNLSILAFSSTPRPPIRVATATKVSVSKRKPTISFGVLSQLSSLSSNSQNPPRASGAWRHSHSLNPVSHLGLLWHLWVTLPLSPRVSEHLC